VKFCTTKNLAAFWLFALFLNAFSIALSAEMPKGAAEKVFCPLTKKFQPVRAPKKDFYKNPLENICADERDKKSFSDELSGKNALKANFLDEERFENLVFDFFKIGKAAFANLPDFPDFPRQNLIKAFSLTAGFNKTEETRILSKPNAEDFSFAQNPRPPNAVSAKFYKPQNARKLEKISRRIAPRAPPFSI
jgi:hypothetical protein